MTDIAILCRCSGWNYTSVGRSILSFWYWELSLDELLFSGFWLRRNWFFLL